MRDIIDKVEYGKRYKEYTAGSKIKTPYTTRIFREMRHRSLPVSTSRVNGEYVKPTLYTAFHSVGSVSKHDLEGPPFWDYFYSEWNSVKLTGEHELYYYYPSTTVMGWGCKNSYPYSPDIPHSVIQRNRARLVEKIRTSDFNLAQAAAEAPESWRTIKSRTLKFLSAYRAFRRGQFRQVSRILGFSPKGTPSTWLEWQYGWRPLLSDVHSACVIIKEGLKSPHFNVESTTLDPDFKNPPPYAQYVGQATSYGKFTRGHKVGVTFSIPEPWLLHADSLGLLNPVALAWELLPYSFVVDWFAHIGEFLSALSLPLALDLKHGYETNFLDTAWEATIKPTGYGGTFPRQVSRTKSMARSPVLGFPIPLPYADPVLNRNQVLNLLALVAQTFR